MKRLCEMVSNTLALTIGLPLLVMLLVATGMALLVWGWEGIAAAWQGLTRVQ